VFRSTAAKIPSSLLPSSHFISIGSQGNKIKRSILAKSSETICHSYISRNPGLFPRKRKRIDLRKTKVHTRRLQTKAVIDLCKSVVTPPILCFQGHRVSISFAKINRLSLRFAKIHRQYELLLLFGLPLSRQALPHPASWRLPVRPGGGRWVASFGYNSLQNSGFPLSREDNPEQSPTHPVNRRLAGLFRRGRGQLRHSAKMLRKNEHLHAIKITLWPNKATGLSLGGQRTAFASATAIERPPSVGKPGARAAGLFL